MYNNKYIYPPFYIIFSSIDKLFFTLFINDSISLKVIIILPIIILFNIIIIYLQTFLGPRFFLCGKCQEPNYISYKTKIELLNLYPNSKDEKCSICLSSFLNENNEDKKDNDNTNTNNDIINGHNNGSKINKGRIKIKTEITGKEITGSKENLKISNNNRENTNQNDVYKYSRYIKNSEQNLKNNNNNNHSIDMDKNIEEINIKKNNDKHNCICTNINGNNIKNIIKIIFWDFYVYSKSKPKYSVLSCNHIFHSICLEKWIKTNRVCPLCKKPLPSNEN